MRRDRRHLGGRLQRQHHRSCWPHRLLVLKLLLLVVVLVVLVVVLLLLLLHGVMPNQQLSGAALRPVRRGRRRGRFENVRERLGERRQTRCRLRIDCCSCGGGGSSGSNSCRWSSLISVDLSQWHIQRQHRGLPCRRGGGRCRKESQRRHSIAKRGRVRACEGRNEEAEQRFQHGNQSKAEWG
jgi:hypothetical protein